MIYLTRLARKAQGWLWLVATLLPIAFSSCIDEISVDLPKAEPMLVVDALISNSVETQRIKLSQTQPFFSAIPDSVMAVVNATVTLYNNLEDSYVFTDPDRDGTYTWQPQPYETLGAEGSLQILTVAWEGQTYWAASIMERVPLIEDLVENDDNSLRFFATDPEGAGDFYRVQIIAYDIDNTGFATEIVNSYSDVVYDASYQPGAGIDGVAFSPAISRITEPYYHPPYEYIGTSKVYIHLHAISLEAFAFLEGIQRQSIQTEAGTEGTAFASFFASPPFNVYSNIQNADPEGKKAVGLFNMANVSSKSIELE